MENEPTKYNELTIEQHQQLEQAWLTIYEGVKVYEQVTGASRLDDAVHAALWEAIEGEQYE